MSIKFKLTLFYSYGNLYRFMRPNTLHAVLSTSNCIAYGQHFFATSTIRDTCWAIIHLAIMNSTLTNQDHPRAWEYLNRLLLLSLTEFNQMALDSGQKILWKIVISTHYFFPAPDSINEHSLDLTTPEGLKDILTLGNIVSVSNLLDMRPGLDAGLKQAAEAERLNVQAEFFLFQDAFSQKFALVMDDEKVDPKTHLFDPFLLHFLITLVKYKYTMKNTFDNAFSFKTLHDGVEAHLQKHHPYMLQEFKKEIRKEKKDLPYLDFFQWSKPFTIVHQHQVEMDSSDGVMEITGM